MYVRFIYFLMGSWWADSELHKHTRARTHRATAASSGGAPLALCDAPWPEVEDRRGGPGLGNGDMVRACVRLKWVVIPHTRCCARSTHHHRPLTPTRYFAFVSSQDTSPDPSDALPELPASPLLGFPGAVAGGGDGDEGGMDL